MASFINVNPCLLLVVVFVFTGLFLWLFKLASHWRSTKTDPFLAVSNNFSSFLVLNEKKN